MKAEMSMIVIVITWLSIILTGIQYNKNKSDAALSAANSTALRGICSFEIMIGHIGVETGSMALYLNRKAGVLFVGVFFALSGYGLMYSIANKENYLADFLPDRIRKIIIPAYIAFIINIIAESIINSNQINMINIVNMKKFFYFTSWYVWELLILYMIFYFSAKLDRSLKKSHVIIFIFSFIFICTAYLVKAANPWYGSTLCFWFGIVYYLNRDKFKEIFVLNYPFAKIVANCILIIIATGLFYQGGGNWLIGRQKSGRSFFYDYTADCSSLVFFKKPHIDVAGKTLI